MQIAAPEKTAEMITTLRKKAREAMQQIEADLSLSSGAPDARITVFQRIILLMNSTLPVVVLARREMLDKDWWNKTFSSIPNENEREGWSDNLLSIHKIGFTQSLFSAVETCFRIYYRALAPGAMNGGTGSFKPLYDDLLTSRLGVTGLPTDAVELLDLLRLVRNSVHNDGVYFSKHGTNSSVAWRGGKYAFTHGKPINFWTWDFALEVAYALVDLIIAVVNHFSIKRLAGGSVDDPAA